jgi:DNA-binding NtrC family response regulator
MLFRSGSLRLGPREESGDVVKLHGTGSLNPGPWPWPGRPRVLVESADDSLSLELTSALRKAGYGVAVCPGPLDHERCPLTGPEGCAIAHGADVVVSNLGLERAEAREVLQALRTRCADIPLVVEISPGQDEEWPELLRGCELVESPVAPDELVSAVTRALESVS